MLSIDLWMKMTLSIVEELDSSEDCGLEINYVEPKNVKSDKKSSNLILKLSKKSSLTVTQSELILKNEKELVAMDLQEEKLHLEIGKSKNNEDFRIYCNYIRSSVKK